MRLKTPRFWYEGRSVAPALLAPLSWLYDAGRRHLQAATVPARAAIPVICIGNIVAGGSGKTPGCLAMMDIVKRHSLAVKPCFLTRGYGGTMTEPEVIDPAKQDARATGDEAQLLARCAPTIVARRRDDGAKLAAQLGHDLIVMDDGLQNPRIYKDIRVVVIDGATGFGNRRLIPAGPLRLPVAEGLAAADAVIIVGEKKTDFESDLAAHMTPGAPIFPATLDPAGEWAPPKNRTGCIAFCGIAHPQKFRATLEKCGATILSFHAYPDHYPYPESELRRLAAIAGERNAYMATTEKDAARIGAKLCAALGIVSLPVVLKLQDESSLATFLRERLASS